MIIGIKISMYYNSVAITLVYRDCCPEFKNRSRRNGARFSGFSRFPIIFPQTLHFSLFSPTSFQSQFSFINASPVKKNFADCHPVNYGTNRLQAPCWRKTKLWAMDKSQFDLIRSQHVNKTVCDYVVNQLTQNLPKLLHWNHVV